MQHLTSSRLRDVLRRHGVRPDKKLGQHFLVDTNIARIIAGHARESDHAVDLGAGPGILTLPLSYQCRRVTAVEIDDRFEPVLAEVLRERGNVEVVFTDARSMDWSCVSPEGAVRVFGNLPYGAAAPILSNFLESGVEWSTAVLMFQREVAERLVAGPGTRDYGQLTLAVRFFAGVRMLRRIGPRSFFPQPEVDSALVQLDPSRPPDIPFGVYMGLVRAGFGLRRKTIRNAFRGSRELGLPDGDVDTLLAAGGIDPRRRGETLSFDEYVHLTEIWCSLFGNDIQRGGRG